MKIITNNKPREILYWYQLTDKEKKEFDYLDDEAKRDEATFFRYRRWCYHLGDFMRCTGELGKWDGYASDSYFSGIVVKYTEDCEMVIAGLYLS